ncbi:MAG: molecular chaperone [Citrobacter amalonaticus]|jgi:P pilus assembly chaperone PapD|nr:molecular chaperone [Citrobacter amalonaticus]
MKAPLLLILLTTSSSLFSLGSSAEGIQLGRTRVVYDANKKEAALPLINTEKELTWLVQSWVMNADNKTRAPFIITPPLFRLDPKSGQSLRVMRSEMITTTDRESLYYLIVRMIPARDRKDEQSNALHLIYRTQIKLFYRPSGLSGTPEEACQNLRYSQSGNQLRIENSSAFYSVFDSVLVGNTQLRTADMVAPKSSVSLTFDAKTAAQSVSWRCINDYGGTTDKFTTSLKP